MNDRKVDTHHKEEQKRKVTYTCVCDMEWRGPHEEEWGDCVCYPVEEKVDK